MPEYDSPVVAEASLAIVAALMNKLVARSIISADDLGDVLNAAITSEEGKPNSGAVIDLIHRIAGSY